MKIWFISDTHCHHDKLEVPAADIVVHCGDEATAREPVLNAPESLAFFEWFGSLPIKHKIFAPGNHSVAFERGMVSVPNNVVPLLGASVVIDGLKFYGSPWTPAWGNSWAYMRPRAKMHDVWQLIPDDTDVLITHGPPKGILDLTHDHDTGELIHVGCRSLRTRVDGVAPRIHAFGHIHDEPNESNFGEYTRGSTTFINCSVCERRGAFKNQGIIKEVQ